MTSLDTRPPRASSSTRSSSPSASGSAGPPRSRPTSSARPFVPALVTAGAGSGKTETMAARVVWLVANGLVRPEQVLGLTFTRKAAGQLADRVRRRLRVLASSPLLDELDPSGDRRAAARAGEPTVSTYHAYAGRLLTEHGLRLPTDPGARLLSPTASWQLAHRIVSTWAADLDTDRVPATVTALVQSLAGELGEHLADPDALRVHAERFCAAVETAPRAKGQRPALPLALEKLVAAQRFRVALLPLVEELAARKRAERCMDFADQMAAAARLADEHPEVGEIERGAFRAVLLDEYQDTGHAQRVLLRALFAGDAATTSPPSATRSSRSTAGAGRARRTCRASSPTSPAPTPTPAAGSGRRRRATVCSPASATRPRSSPSPTGSPSPCARWTSRSTGCDRARARPPATSVSRCTPTSRPSGRGSPTQWPTAGARRRPRRRPADQRGPRAAPRRHDRARRGPARARPARRGRRPRRAARRARGPRRGVRAAPGRRPARRRRGGAAADRGALAHRGRRPRRAVAARPRAGRARARRRSAPACPTRCRPRCPASTPSGPGWWTPSTTPARPRATPPPATPGCAASAGELTSLRRRVTAPLVDLVADVERVAAARRRDRRAPRPHGARPPRRVRRRRRRLLRRRHGLGRHRHRDGAAGLPRRGRGGRGRADPRRGRRRGGGHRRHRGPGAHRARRQGPRVGAGRPAPRVRQGLPRHQAVRVVAVVGRRRCRSSCAATGPTCRCSTSPAPSTARRSRGCSTATSGRSTTAASSRSGACSTWRSPAPNASCWCPGTGGARPATSRAAPPTCSPRSARSPPRAPGAAVWSTSGPTPPEEGAPNPMADAVHEAVWPQDPLGARGRGRRGRRPGPSGPPAPPAWPADEPTTRARYRDARRPTPTAGPRTSTCCWPSGRRRGGGTRGSCCRRSCR